MIKQVWRKQLERANNSQALCLWWRNKTRLEVKNCLHDVLRRTEYRHSRTGEGAGTKIGGYLRGKENGELPESPRFMSALRTGNSKN